MAYSLDGQGYIIVVGNVTLASLFDGEHYVTVFAWDGAGNVGESVPVRLGVETQAAVQPAETQSSSFPIPVTVVAAILVEVSFGLLAYFAKFKKKRNEA